MQDLKFKKNILPEINLRGVGLILISEWLVNGSEEQVKVADAALKVWEQFQYPEGLLSYSCYLSVDGKYIAYYWQWKDEVSQQQFLHLLKHKKKINETLQMERQMVGKFRLCRSAVSDTSAVPGCIVIVRREYESAEITSKFIDAAYNAVKAEEQEWTGCISANFHISMNGLVMVNYAEWTSEQAYQEFVDQSNKDTFIGLSTLWKEVREFPYKPIYSSFKMYRFYRSIVKI